MRLTNALLLIVLASMISACGGTPSCDKPQPYQTARPGQKVEAPDGLDELQASREVAIPEASRVRERKEGEPCLDYPPVMRTDSSGDDS